MILVAGNDAAEVLQPGKKPFDLTAAVAPERPGILGDDCDGAVRSTPPPRLAAPQATLQRITVIGGIPNEALGFRHLTMESSALSRRVTSRGEALPMDRLTGRPARSAIAMILVPWPSLVVPTREPLLWPPRRCRR